MWALTPRWHALLWKTALRNEWLWRGGMDGGRGGGRRRRRLGKRDLNNSLTCWIRSRCVRRYWSGSTRWRRTRAVRRAWSRDKCRHRSQLVSGSGGRHRSREWCGCTYGRWSVHQTKLCTQWMEPTWKFQPGILLQLTIDGFMVQLKIRILTYFVQ